MKDRLSWTIHAVRVYNQLVVIKAESDLMCELDTFTGISDIEDFYKDGKFAELANPVKDEIISKVKSIKFLIDLLPEANKGEFDFRRMCLKSIPGMDSRVSELIDEQTIYLKRKYDAFRKDLQSTLSQSISAFYKRSIEARCSQKPAYLD